MTPQEVIKILESSPQKGQEMFIIGIENLNEIVLEWAKANNKKIAIDTLLESKAKELGFKYPKVKRTIAGYEIRHALNKHASKNEHIPLTLQHIIKWIEYATSADKHLITKDNIGQEVLVSAKQINEYYCVIVESIRKKGNELAFKTMYFSKGYLSKNKSFQTANDQKSL